MSKADIQDAFYLIPIKFSDHRLLGFHWGGIFYHESVLPMGASSSCQLFKKFSSALQWILGENFKIKGVSHLLDDVFIVGKAHSNECSVA